VPVWAVAPAGATAGSDFQVGVKLDTPGPARWLRFEAAPRLLHGRRPGAAFPIAALVFLTVVPLLALSLWAVRQVTRPLARLAEVTNAIGADDPLSPIPEAGTREIRMLARAFNGLLERLRRFVAERTRVLAAVSHDLRTPLTRLRLRAETVEDAALRERLLKDVRMMELMIGSSLALLEAQEKREPIEVVDLGALLQTICDEFSDAGFEVSYAGPLHCPARCQPRALERALNNVIDNAHKFGGAAEVALRVAGASLEIDVEDEGPGIPVEERENVLKPFYRLSEARGAETPGSGLGLAIAQTLVEGQGGALALRDRAPRGLCVRLTLPRV
jgi:signal transduction histidine kinase